MQVRRDQGGLLGIQGQDGSGASFHPKPKNGRPVGQERESGERYSHPPAGSPPSLVTTVSVNNRARYRGGGQEAERGVLFRDRIGATESPGHGLPGSCQQSWLGRVGLTE